MIRHATIADLPRMEEWAREFYASSKHLRTFQMERFVRLWTGFIEAGTGVIILAIDGNEITGAIGGIVHKDLYCGELIASEFFWFVRPQARGTIGGFLYVAFERWARAQGCETIQMVHLLDLMPERVRDFYLKRGFDPVETRYVKKLKAEAETEAA